MKKIIIALLLCGAFAASAQTTRWDIDDTHAKIGFTISHFGISETEGRFTKFNGTVLTDHPDFIGAKVDFTVDANSVNTDNEQRDNHLRSPDFFDATKYPQIIFKGKSLKQVSGNKYQLVGDLTMHGVTREVTLDALYRGTVPQDPFGNTKAGFKISGVLDRTQWGLAWTGKLASGDLLVGNDVDIECNIELTKAK